MIVYDVIGDIHGHASKLELSLLQMGYKLSGRGYKAPQGRQAVFRGDLIDRGPEQLGFCSHGVSFDTENFRGIRSFGRTDGTAVPVPPPTVVIAFQGG